MTWSTKNKKAKNLIKIFKKNDKNEPYKQLMNLKLNKIIDNSKNAIILFKYTVKPVNLQLLL